MENDNRFQNAMDAADSGQFSQGMQAVSRMFKVFFTLLTVIIGLMVVWFFTLGGFFIVDSTKETVLLLQFGKLKEKCEAGGVYWSFPYPVSKVIRVPKTNQTIRSLTFMPADRTSITERKNDPSGSSLNAALTPGRDGFLLTGDNSIIHTEWELVYRVTQPETYYKKCLTPERPLDPDEVMKGDDGELLGTRGASTLIKNVLDDCIIKVTATWDIKDILYDKTTDYILAVESRLVKQLNDMQIGIAVESLALPVKRPPLQTIAAFDEAASASTQATIEIETAKAKAIEAANSAKSESAMIIADAESYKARIEAQVKADISYFEAILREYRKNPDAVMVSLYSNTLADAMALVKDKFILSRIQNSRQELRLKLNPEPVIKKTDDKTAKDQK